jgi:hypothetical protein
MLSGMAGIDSGRTFSSGYRTLQENMPPAAEAAASAKLEEFSRQCESMTVKNESVKCSSGKKVEVYESGWKDTKK